LPVADLSGHLNNLDLGAFLPIAMIKAYVIIMVAETRLSLGVFSASG
jgi:hypothetical protein